MNAFTQRKPWMSTQAVQFPAQPHRCRTIDPEDIVSTTFLTCWRRISSDLKRLGNERRWHVHSAEHMVSTIEYVCVHWITAGLNPCPPCTPLWKGFWPHAELLRSKLMFAWAHWRTVYHTVWTWPACRSNSAQGDYRCKREAKEGSIVLDFEEERASWLRGTTRAESTLAQE